MKSASIITAIVEPIKPVRDLAYWQAERKALGEAIEIYPKLGQYRTVKMQLANIAKQIKALTTAKPSARL